jgi:ATP-dependent DNA helicase RecG
MNEQELRDLIASDEADRVEFTIATKDTDKFSEAVCAFSNDLPRHDRPGHLIIGVDNAGHFAGFSVSDELLRNLGGLRDDGNIQPLPTITVEKVSTSQGEVAVVTVQPASLPPVRYKGRICIRNGPRRGYATEHEERILIERRVSQAKTFDAQPCLDSKLDDLAASLFVIDYLQQAVAAEVIAENKRTVELEDCLEIQRPGGQYGEASPANIPRQSFSSMPVTCSQRFGGAHEDHRVR